MARHNQSLSVSQSKTTIYVRMSDGAMATGLNDDEELEGMVRVALPSGAKFQVHDSEFQYFTERSSKYLSDNDFQNISDYQDVDRLLILELLSYRNGIWISQLRDYWGDPIDDDKLQKTLSTHSAEIRQLKKSLGLDRETREKVRGEDSVENYLARLRQRAKHFGYKRNKESAMAIELWKELEAFVTLYKNCDERERIEQQCTLDHLFEWLDETAFPRFNEIDEKFREEQTTWIREM
jgi:hypothetical protein